LSLVVEYSGGWTWVIGELKAFDSFSMVGGRSWWVLSWGGDPGGWAVVAQGELPLLWWQCTESCMGFVLWSGFLVSGGLRMLHAENYGLSAVNTECFLLL
jgi:hypothetical protein